MELAGRGKDWSRRRNWADFGPGLNSSGSSHLSRHRQGRLAGGVAKPGGSVGLGGALGGPAGGLGGLQGGIGGLQGGLDGPAAGRKRQATELPSVCD